MGRAGPLTVLVLGRSPYDVAVPGEGDDDPREPPQQYDSHGRPVNPETRRINRDIVRAHNEVMMVIGVAELEHSATTSIADATADQYRCHRDHFEREYVIGTRLLSLDRMLEMMGVWGIVGLRQRILLYKRYTNVSIWDILLLESRERSSLKFASSGLLVALLNEAIKNLIAHLFPCHSSNRWYWLRDNISQYLHIHVLFYATLQRLDLIPATQWLPHWTYFIPFTATSPLPPIKFPSAWTRPALAGWAFNTAMRIGPFVAFYAMRAVWARLQRFLFQEVMRILPSTVVRRRSSRLEVIGGMNETGLVGVLQLIVRTPTRWFQEWRGAQVGTLAPGSGSVPDFDSEPILATDRTTVAPLTATAEGSRPEEPSLPPASQPNAGEDLRPTRPNAEVSRQSLSRSQAGIDTTTLDHDATSTSPTTRPPSSDSSHPSTDDDTSSEFEDVEAASAPIIAFDVEATEATEPVDPTSAAMWSAELRTLPGPNLHDTSPRSGVQSPIYFDTMLTRLPAVFAGQVFAVMTSTVLITPLESITLRFAARAWRARMGLGVDDMLPIISWPGGLKWYSALMGVAFARLLVNMEIWSMVTGSSLLLHLSEDEWKQAWTEKEERRMEEDAVDSEAEERPVVANLE